MNRISVRGEVLAFPKMCCCCGDPKARRRYKALGKYVGRWVNTTYHEKRWWEIPICKRCDQWIRATRASSLWLIQFIVSVTIGIFSIAPSVLLGFGSILGIACGIIALTLLAFSALAFAVWRWRRSQSLRLDPGPPCSIYPVILVEWLRDKHTFEFSNRDYFHQFAILNRDRVS
jgi:hypothetical protein